MEITTERNEDFLIVSVQGRVDGTNAAMFQKGVEGAIGDAGASAVILDMEGLSYMSSAGLRSVLLLAKGLRWKGVDFAVCSMIVSVREVFRIVGFDKIVSVHESRSEATATFSK